MKNKLLIALLSSFSFGQSVGEFASLELKNPGNIISYIDFKGKNNQTADFVGRLDYTDGSGFSFSKWGLNFNLLKINENGNVGVGANNPDQKFVVDFNGEPKQIKFFQPSSNAVYTQISSLMFTWYNEHSDIGIIRGNTSDIIGLGFRFNGDEKMRLASNGNLGIGTLNPDSKLTVKGNIHANEVKVDLAVPADYVFQKYYTGNSILKPSYQFKSLEEIKLFTEQNHHLPDLPSAKEIQENGLKLGEMNNILLQKIEELTLHLIEQNEKIELLTKEINQLKQNIL